MKSRHAGIEGLRLGAMLMIVITHVIMWGDLDHDLWLTGFAAMGGLGVSIFGMITGYVSYTEEPRAFSPKRYWRTWLTVFFYGVGITLVWKLVSPELVDLKTLVLSFFPVASARWWYFSSWTGVFFLQPVLLTLVRHFEFQRRHVFGFLVFSVYATGVGLFKDPFGLGWGYSTLWLCVLFVIGALLKKHHVTEKVPMKTVRVWLTAACICLFFGTPLAAKLSVQALGSLVVHKLHTDYTSPLVTMCAVLMMVTGLQIDVQGKKIFELLGPASFGIYIIHCHPCAEHIIRKYSVLLQDRAVLDALFWRLSWRF